ncbi:MAG: glutamate--tRNA ligase [Bacteroidota bacterium]
MSQVRVRFAPSPTGYLHVGGLRTALYNYLFARKHQGTFILRIEDTDRTRLVEGAVENLIDTLRWAGLEFDEGPGKGGPDAPYVQSERLPIYREHAERLLRERKAYYAFDTPEELEEMRKRQEKMRIPPKYDRRALKLTAAEVELKLASGIPAVVRMKVPETETVAFDDIIRGRVEFSSDRLDDQVLLKSDGYPTYHLANVVDDHLMGITHVIRGEEWLSSTPKHVLLYRYLGWEIPQFAHLPLLLNPDRSKLSKRQGDVAVEDYRAKGFFPEALVNFVALLGWNPGDEREIFSLQDLVREFSLERVGKSGAVFNLEKLHWMNTEYLRRRSNEDLVTLLRPKLAAAGLEGFSDSYLMQVVGLMKERVNSVEEFLTFSSYFFRDPGSYDEASRKKNWTAETSTVLRDVAQGLDALAPCTATGIEEVVRVAAAKRGISAGKVIHPLRLALTGVALGPGLFELMAVLGKETCVRRIESAIARFG